MKILKFSLIIRLLFLCPEEFVSSFLLVMAEEVGQKKDFSLVFFFFFFFFFFSLFFFPPRFFVLCSVVLPTSRGCFNLPLFRSCLFLFCFVLCVFFLFFFADRKHLLGVGISGSKRGVQMAQHQLVRNSVIIIISTFGFFSFLFLFFCVDTVPRISCLWTRWTRAGEACF